MDFLILSWNLNLTVFFSNLRSFDGIFKVSILHSFKKFSFSLVWSQNFLNLGSVKSCRLHWYVQWNICTITIISFIQDKSITWYTMGWISYWIEWWSTVVGCAFTDISDLEIQTCSALYFGWGWRCPGSSPHSKYRPCDQKTFWRLTISDYIVKRGHVHKLKCSFQCKIR